MLTYFLIILLTMTYLTFALYSYDFSVAVGQWKHLGRPRISEYILLTATALGGGYGAWTAMKVERHKAGDGKKHFHFVIYFSMVVNLIAFIMLLVSERIGG